MTTVFSRIIAGDIPGTFVWRDERCVVFMSISPMAYGHALVVPIEELDHWVDGSPDLIAHLFEVTRIIGVAQRHAFGCERVGVIIAGYEVPHTHVHVIPTNAMSQLAFANAAASVDRADLESAAAAIRAQLTAMGRPEVAGGSPRPGGDSVEVSGLVRYRERIALPPGAVVVVRVLDVSRADAPSVTIAEQRIEPTHQVPIPFSLQVPQAALVPPRQYSVAARIDVDGELAWSSATHHPVATDGPTTVDILVVNAQARF